MTTETYKRSGNFRAAIALVPTGDPGNGTDGGARVRGSWEPRDMAEPAPFASPEETAVVQRRLSAARGFLFALAAGLFLWVVMLGLLAKLL